VHLSSESALAILQPFSSKSRTPTTVRSRYKRHLIRLNMKKKWPTRTGMEDSRPIFFCKRFSYNENALYCKRVSSRPLPPRSTVGLRPRSWESPNFLVYSCIQDFTGLHFLHKRRFFVHDSCMGVAQSQARSQLQTV